MPSTQVVPAQRSAPAPATVPCPTLGALTCQRPDPHVRGHVYHGAWAPDRHRD